MYTLFYKQMYVLKMDNSKHFAIAEHHLM